MKKYFMSFVLIGFSVHGLYAQKSKIDQQLEVLEKRVANLEKKDSRVEGRIIAREQESKTTLSVSALLAEAEAEATKEIAKKREQEKLEAEKQAQKALEEALLVEF